MKLTQRDIELAYNDFLDGCYGEAVNIAGNFYCTSDALKEVDPTAYRCGLADYVDSQLTDGVWFEHSDGSIHDSPETKD